MPAEIIIIIIIIGRFISPTPGTVGLKFKTNIGRYIKATEYDLKTWIMQRI